ncbi:MAG: putative MAPEG superfamily protein [Paracoccaceae bacterium]|jgi:uncharacterized MAPEG superfamily protein
MTHTSLLPPEAFWLVLTLILTALLWVPYILQLIFQLGPVQAIWDPTGAHPHDADWALRAKRAHYNAVENLVIFAPLTLLVLMFEVTSPLTQAAASVYFFARLAHFGLHVLAVPVLRTLAFVTGFLCQMTMAMALLDVI